MSCEFVSWWVGEFVSWRVGKLVSLWVDGFVGLWACGFMQSGVCRGALVYKAVSWFALHFVLRGVCACVGIAKTTNSSQITEILKVKTTSMCGQMAKQAATYCSAEQISWPFAVCVFFSCFSVPVYPKWCREKSFQTHLRTQNRFLNRLFSLSG